MKRTKEHRMMHKTNHRFSPKLSAVLVMFLVLISFKVQSQDVPAAQRQALIDLYNATNGPNWTDSSNWNTAAPVTDWFGVTVVNDNVTAVQLGNNNLTGTIPSSMADLTQLVTLRLNSNNLTGNIPASLGNLTQLQTLYCRINQLSGNLPSELGNLTALRILDFGSNNLSGPLPTSLGGLSSLRGLELNNNQFTGTIPVNYSNLSSLLELKLNANQLTGSIPPEFGNMSGLEQLWLQGNQLSGSIPAQLGTAGNVLDDFQASSNQLTGSIPAELGNLTSLRFLSLSNNQLSGSIPATLGNLPNLIDLNLQSNNLTGNIPPELGNMTSLLDLRLTSNQLSGPIPATLANIASLRGVFVSDNNLSGQIPSFTASSSLINFLFDVNGFVFSDFETEHPSYLTNISNIYRFSPQSKVDLEENQSVTEGQSITLSSTALTSPNNGYQWYKDGTPIAGATSKDYVISNATLADAGVYHFEATNSIVSGLTLTRNDITLTVDADPCGVSAIQKQALLDLYNATNGDNWTNTLAGNQPWDTNIPVCDWFGVTVVGGQVVELELENNSLSGTLTSSLQDLGALQVLSLFSNQLAGTIPSELGTLSNLRDLYLSGNELSGTIPIELGSLSALQNLYLNNNNLSGGIPSELGNLLSLQDLTLNINQLTGQIPSVLGNLTNLKTLNLNDNQLSGAIPASIGNLTNLELLQLSDNQLSGSIPPEFGNLANLNFLYLNLNQLSGEIPPQVGNMSNLQVIWLMNNQLSGPIPVELGNLSNLVRLLLYDNELSGEIPAVLSSLSNLGTLNLGDNKLSGNIPDFTSLPLTNLAFYSNEFTFSSFETEHPSYQTNVSTYNFSPQAKVDAEETLSVPENGSITLSSTALTSPNNSYQWYKDGTPIAGATSKDYVISSATPADAGVYYFEATNSIVSGLTLTRNNITLTVDADPCGVSAAEKQALLDFYNATNGDNWTNTLAGNQPWDTNIPVCDWFGITVVDGEVKRVILLNNSLTGLIPSSVSNLIHLTELSLNNNNITGSIPSSLGSLLNLQILKLEQNNLSGTLPSELGGLTNLRRMEIWSNNLSGSIPIQFGNLDSIEIFHLANNSLSGTIPSEIGNLSTLNYLNLGGNELEGPIPFQLQNLSALTSLWLFDNNFTGEVPGFISSLTNLQALVLYRNDFSGVLPATLSTLTSLNYVDVGQNNLSGALPFDTSFQTNLSTLDFENNGYIFSDFEADHPSFDAEILNYRFSPQAKVDLEETQSVIEGQSITLTTTTLTSPNNSYQWFKDGSPIAGATSKDYVLSSAAPADAGVYYFEATNSIVTGLALTRNNITLSVDVDPCGVSAVEKQALLDLYNATNGDNWANTLAGNQPWDTNIPVCDWYGVTVVNGLVTELELNQNGLSGTISPSIGDLTNLTTLFLHINQLSGTIPVELGNLTNLQNLNLSSNQLTGVLPTELGNIGSNLRTLIISSNQLTGDIPVVLGNLSGLQTLILSNNDLTGTIPIEIGGLTNLRSLWLFGNQLVGNIPTELANLSQLEFLLLYNNQLSGNIPPEIGNLSNLLQLFLYNNQLTGTIPTALANLTNLNSLQLNQNQLQGTIPPELGNLIGLKTLYLHQNQLSGPIPTTLGDLPILERLYVFGNQLNGDLPTTLSTSSTLQFLFVYENQFVFSNFEQDFIQLQTTLGNNFRYDPQAKVDLLETLEVPENGSITLSSTALTSPNNSYQWFKDGVAIPGATSKDYVISGATPADAGVYYFEATNSVVTGLTLVRNDISLTIGPPLCGVSEPERQALLDLYAATDGDNWINTQAGIQPWDPNTSVCDWFGVTVENGTVTALNLPNNNLIGSLPESMGNLLNATTINLENNGLSGSIPGGLGSLLNLDTLDLSDNGFTGELPPALGSLTSLVLLDLSNNNLQSQIPISFCNLTNVTDLDLSFNQLFGSIPNEIRLMSSLIRVNLSNNQLNGTVPAAVASLPNLEEVRLDNNQLSGVLPFTVVETSRLDLLTFENNKFIFSNFETKHPGYSQYLNSGYGFSPQAKTDKEETKSVTLGNSITLTTELSSPNNTYVWYKDGTVIPDAVTNEFLIENADATDQGTYYFIASNSVVAGLQLERNTITLNVITSCDVPLAERQALITLYNATGGAGWANTVAGQQAWDVSDNTSLICDWFGVTVENNTVTEINLPNNQLSGSIPDVFGAFPALRRIDLSSNELSGTINGLFSTISSLQTLALENNNFIFSDIEADFSTLSTALSSGFTYTPQAKVDAEQTENVEAGESLTLSSSVLTSINNSYQWFKNGLPIAGATDKDLVLNNITSDDAAAYHFSATNSVVSGLTLERRMVMVSLNNPDDACGVSDAERQILLNFYDLLDGPNWTNNNGWDVDTPVCDWFGITTDAEANVIGIQLPANGLRGEIPAELSGLVNLRDLDLSNNNVIGDIPGSLGDLSLLETLILNGNILVGQIPANLSNALALTTLNLGNNRFSGVIPAGLGNLQQLQTLDLNNNKLNGGIPIDLYNALSLTRINLSDNQLSGGVSANIGNLQFLEEFWLSNNSFSGSIPTTITNIPVLRSVRINNNSFGGDIPLLIPDFNVPGTEVQIQNNRFVFSDFEPEYPDYSTQLDIFSYDPQARVDRTETIYVLEGNSVTLGTEDLSSPNNSYVWYKDGVEIPGVTGDSYTITNFTTADEGVYYFIASNNVIPILELERNRITLIEGEPPTPILALSVNVLCSEDPLVTQEWQIANPNAVAVNTSWIIDGTTQTGSLTAVPGTTLLTTQTEAGSNSLVLSWTDENGLSQSVTRTWNGGICEEPEDCIDLLTNAGDGSFETASNSISTGRNGNLDGTGWTATQGSPDTFSPPVSNSSDPYLRAEFGNSPNGGIVAGALRVADTAEGLSTTLSGLEPGQTYIVEFYQANASNLLADELFEEVFGFWQVAFGGQTTNSEIEPPSVAIMAWTRQKLEFTASSTSENLSFSAGSTTSDPNNAYPVYMLIDGIKVYLKPTDPFSAVCSDVEIQVFCNTDAENEPTFAQLVSPVGTPVEWYSQAVGGTRYFSNDRLGDLESFFVWADDGSGDRTAVEIVLDQGAPEGDQFQFFDIASNPTIASLELEGTNVAWYDSFTSTEALPTNTPLISGDTYYAAQAGNECRLAVEVLIAVPEPVGDGFQEFCSTENPTVADLVMGSTSPVYNVLWYSDETGGAALNSTDSLQDGTTYWAVQTNGTDSTPERIPVRVSVIDVDSALRTYQSDVEVSQGTTIEQLSSFFGLDAAALWYNDPLSGTAYSNLYQLIEGETYYSRVGGGRCEALEVIAVTIAIGEVVGPELITCIKFIPTPGDHYVIGGWVREDQLIAEPAGTAEFTTVKDVFIDLLDFLTAKILNKEEIPAGYVLKSDPAAPNFDELLPFVKNSTDKNLTVYNFQFETETVEGLEKSVGYSFSLDPDDMYRFVYRTPEVALEFDDFSENGVLVFPRGYHYPIRNYEGLEITYTDVAIVGGKFRISSNFTVPAEPGSNIKVNYTNQNTDSTTDSGLSESIQLFNYSEDPDYMVMDYENAVIELTYRDLTGNDMGSEKVVLQPKGAVIDGWQRISGDFTIPDNASYMRITLRNLGNGLNTYFDDVRMHPFNSNMKSFVYDPVTQRLQAELDENNYATFYEYDTEGGLVRVKKETERGVYTIQETRSGNSKLNSGSE